jgi:hypothetical protein
LEWFLGFVPFYYELKILLLLWMIFPLRFLGAEISGASFIYNHYFEPLMASREVVVDEMLVEFGLSSLASDMELKKRE